MSNLITLPNLQSTSYYEMYKKEFIIQEVQWFKNVGDSITKGEVFCAIENDEVTYEFESLYTGEVLYIHTNNVIRIGDIIMVIGTAGENYKKTMEEYYLELKDNTAYQQSVPMEIRNKPYVPVIKKDNAFWNRIKAIFNL